MYAAPAALVVYAALGSSRHLVVGPMSATAALSAAAVAELATQGSGRFAALTAALAITAGVIGIIAGLARLGFVANFISEPVLKGFIIGLALMIVAGQLPNLFGIPKGSGNFFEQLWHLLGELDETHWLTLLVGLVSLALILGLKRVAPMVPGSLVAVVFGILVVQLLDLDRHGAAIVGHIQPGLPPGIARRRHGRLPQARSAAVGILLVGFAEGLGAAKTYAARQHYEVDIDRELLGVGAANLGAGLSGGMVVSGSLSETAVNGAAGQYGDLERHPENQQLPGIVILRVESSLFSANADAVRQSVRAHAAEAGTRVVVLDAETVPAIDLTAVHMLTELAESLKREGIRLLVTREIGQVRDVVREVATDTTPEGVYPTIQAAVQAAQQAPDATSSEAPGGDRDAH